MFQLKMILLTLTVVFLSVVSPLPVLAGGNRILVSGDFKDDTVNKVILQLCEAAGASAVLNEESIKELVVSATIENKPLDEALAIILAPFDLAAVAHVDSKGEVCYTVKSALAAQKPSKFTFPDFPVDLNGPLKARFENTDLPDALRKILEANARSYGQRDDSKGIPMSYTWCDKRMKGIKVAILSDGADLGTIFHALLEITGLGYEFDDGLFYIAPQGYFDPEVRFELPDLESTEAQTPIWLLYHDKSLNDILDDLFDQVKLEYSSPSVEIKGLKSSIRLEGIPFAIALEAVLLPQRLTYSMAGDTIIIKYPMKW